MTLQVTVRNPYINKKKLLCLFVIWYKCFLLNAYVFIYDNIFFYFFGCLNVLANLCYVMMGFSGWVT